jgi:hypothetical protein
VQRRQDAKNFFSHSVAVAVARIDYLAHLGRAPLLSRTLAYQKRAREVRRPPCIARSPLPAQWGDHRNTSLGYNIYRCR